MNLTERIAAVIHNVDGNNTMGAGELAKHIAANFPDETEVRVRHIVFLGQFEEFWSMQDAENRIEELLNEGHDNPTVVNASLGPDGDVLALRGVKYIQTAEAGEIR